jgi:Bacterial capsule synthesis protein PGA_cap
MSAFTLAAAGDILIDRAQPSSATAEVADLLNEADLAFANFEGVMTDSQQPTPGSAHATVVPSANAAGLFGFHVLSLANNHSMDAGYQGLMDSIETLSHRGIRPVGAGRNLAEALAPVVVERNGTRVAILAVTSVFRVGVEARRSLPGIAPLRADEYYASRIPGVHNPGLTPRVATLPHEPDWRALEEEIVSARNQADLVVVSVHWGDFTQPWVLTEHERSSARRIIASGADMVLGHHHHFQRGMEHIDGKPVFYGLGHLVFDHPRFIREMTDHGIDMDGIPEDELRRRYGEYGIYPRKETPTLPFHALARFSGIAVIQRRSNGGRFRTGMVPCYLDTHGTPKRVPRSDPASWTRSVEFLRECQRRAALSTALEDNGWTVGKCDVVEFVPERG